MHFQSQFQSYFHRYQTLLYQDHDHNPLVPQLHHELFQIMICQTNPFVQRQNHELIQVQYFYQSKLLQWQSYQNQSLDLQKVCPDAN